MLCLHRYFDDGNLESRHTAFTCEVSDWMHAGARRTAASGRPADGMAACHHPARQIP